MGLVICFSACDDANPRIVYSKENGSGVRKIKQRSTVTSRLSGAFSIHKVFMSEHGPSNADEDNLDGEERRVLGTSHSLGLGRVTLSSESPHRLTLSSGKQCVWTPDDDHSEVQATSWVDYYIFLAKTIISRSFHHSCRSRQTTQTRFHILQFSSIMELSESETVQEFIDLRKSKGQKPTVGPNRQKSSPGSDFFLASCNLNNSFLSVCWCASVYCEPGRFAGYSMEPSAFWINFCTTFIRRLLTIISTVSRKSKNG